MNISQNGIKLLKIYESLRLNIYKDTRGFPTIGFGHKLTQQDIISKRFNQGITIEDAENLVKSDLKPFVDNVNEHVCTPLNQNQFDALVIFSFNIGVNGFNTSTALKEINASDLKDVPDAMRRFNKTTIKGKLKVSPGLINRREKEIDLWYGKL